ncbi:hypothetical protein [Curtobacterium sp. MCBA15_012]|uniref:hypothetical protein n=1 Tax=Curtobacterium sp. MCBA15_012 TaxID=1898738 RepID=UPI0008DE5005|nr:hypothetical protein [Curtobacterium sp. MCBA15_012]WIB01642.1 hypothetical protein QOL15_08135 [Curtobacterium sp. MCBA15_012]
MTETAGTGETGPRGDGSAARATAVSMTAALLATAVAPVVELAGGDVSATAVRLLGLLGAVLAVVAIVLGQRRKDLPTMVLGAGIALGTLSGELPNPSGVVLVSPAGVLFLVAVALVAVAGVLVAARTVRWPRAVGILLAVLGALRLGYLVCIGYTPALLALPQDSLGVALALPALLALLVLLVAALLFAPVVFAPVGRGVRWLWRTADVR